MNTLVAAIFVFLGVAVNAAPRECSMEVVSGCFEKSFPTFLDTLGNIIAKPDLLKNASLDVTLLKTLCSSHQAFADCLGGTQEAIKCLAKVVGEQGVDTQDSVHGAEALFQLVDFTCQTTTKRALIDNMDKLITFAEFVNDDPQVTKCVGDVFASAIAPTGPLQLQPYACSAIPKVYSQCLRQPADSQLGKSLTDVFCGQVDTIAAPFQCSPPVHTCA